MSQASVASGLVRVSVASGSRRVDLVLPGAIPVAELVPELARSVGLLDASTVHGGYDLVTQEGRVLAGDAGLLLQGIEDGVLLTVTAGVDREVPRVYDDIVEAMADVVEQELKPWEPAAGRRTALCGGALLLGLGAVALLLRGESLVSGVAAALVAALLVIGGILLSRGQGESEAGVVVSLLAAAYAAVAGLALAPGDLPPWVWPMPDAFFALPVVWAGIGVLLVGLVAVVGLDEGRSLVIPPIVVGAVLVACGVVVHLTTFDPSVVVTVVLTLVVLSGSVFPWLALGVTGTRAEALHPDRPLGADAAGVDAAEVSRDAQVGHEILLAVSATVGALLVLFAPVVVGRGAFGTALAAACCLALMFRTRQYRAGSEVLAGLLSGVVGLVSVAVSMLLIHDGWREGAAIALAVLGAVLLLVTVAPTSSAVRRGRWGDVCESLTLLSLLPLMVLAAGFVDAVAG